MNTFQPYYDAVRYLEGISNLPLKYEYMRDRQKPELYLKRMRYFLDLLGNPHADFIYIHVTGTAGKGSVTTMIHEILHKAGKRVGSVTSPFVTTTIEKMKYGNAYIDPLEFADIVEVIKPAIDAAYKESPYGRPSYFEILLAIAFVFFKRKKCEWVVLEVGCGGRFDYTNVIKTSRVAVITNIDYDHTDLLGNSLREIAYEKAGIVKKRSVLFTSEQRPALLKLFSHICEEKKTVMHALPKQQDYDMDNKFLVTEVCRHLSIKEKYIEEGIASARLPARFEIIKEKSNGPVVVIDGAHNPRKIESTVSRLRLLSYRKLFLILGVSSKKDSNEILKRIMPCADVGFFTRSQVSERKCIPPLDLIRSAKKYTQKKARMDIFLDPSMALNQALKEASLEDLVLVTGSFFLAGELRKRWFPEEYILRKRSSF